MISSGDIPSYWAHTINTIKHAQAFYELGYNVELCTVKRLFEKILKNKIRDVHNFYNIPSDLIINYFKENFIFYFKDLPYLKPFIRGVKNQIPILRYIFDPEEKISNYCKKKDFHLTYCRCYRAAYYNILQNIPTIIEIHTNQINKPEVQKLFKLSKNKSFLGIITISEGLKKKYINGGIPSEKILIIEDAVEIKPFQVIKKSKFELRSELGIPSDKKIIMYSGSLKPGKGINKILKTANKFESETLFYILGGEPEFLKYWKKKAREKNLTNLFFKGFVSQKMVPLYLKCADILFLPFDLNEERRIMDINTTSPMKLFEYMASKKPIVSLKLPTITKIVKHKKEAFLTDSDEPNEYARAIDLLLENKALRKLISKNAYEKSKQFTYKIRCKKIISKFIK